MEVRIGVIQSPRELSLELPADTDREALQAQITDVLAASDKVLWLKDRRGRQVAVASGKIAYVELGAGDDDRRIGFGS